MISIDRPKLTFGVGPTPIDLLPRLSDRLGGPRIHMKRDDLTGFALGGNKVRKLEYLVADALAQGADTLVTIGGVQSNHCRQTAAAAARAGLRCHLVLTRGALDTEDFLESGNVLLDRLVGATLHFVGAVPDKDAALAAVRDEVAAAGGKPYVVPLGGSSPLGSLGYVAAVEETDRQVSLSRFAAVVVTTGSAGTHAGLAAGLALLGGPTELVGVSCSASADVVGPKIAGLARGALDLLGRTDVATPVIEVNDAHVGAGYGVVTAGGLEAIELCARLEGIYLDPVYTGKAMAGLVGMIRDGRFGRDDEVLFVHTGGSPALFAYRGELGAAVSAPGCPSE